MNQWSWVTVRTGQPAMLRLAMLGPVMLGPVTLGPVTRVSDVSMNLKRRRLRCRTIAMGIAVARTGFRGK
ncbi:hypothetical protein K227x_42750 [Rubripirellula lacrimiformis]|uniref:Uncharacterized protein n=1 Tax=Rubripirellula lacrimiformis TaxID=1930273 RepID=A0A517NFF8_9BACT|nr:hypothetical protein [Rubripirellula lacrimiformis]QDT05870.1 hypothetical protein K227x_42750 [Rubripirellula lacrimiformis]